MLKSRSAQRKNVHLHCWQWHWTAQGLLMLHSYSNNSLLGGEGHTGTQSSSSAGYFLFSGTESLVAIALCLSTEHLFLNIQVCFLFPKVRWLELTLRVERVLVFQSLSEQKSVRWILVCSSPLPLFCQQWWKHWECLSGRYCTRETDELVCRN